MHVPGTIDDLMAFFDAKPGTAYDWAGRYSIAPSTRAPIVREWLDDGDPSYPSLIAPID